MSNFNLSKKLQPAKKAWKGFKNHLRSKLHRHPTLFKAITTLRQRCTTAWRSIAPFIHRKFLSLTKRAPPHYHHRHLHHHHRHRFHPSHCAIYVDELFPGPTPLVEPRKTKENMAESSAAKSVNKSRPESTTATHDAGKIQTKLVDTKGTAEAGESSKTSAAAEKWKIPSLPQFRGIDERAEEFIAKFHEHMKLEREQSMLDFEEMLKRSA